MADYLLVGYLEYNKQERFEDSVVPTREAASIRHH